MITDVIILGGTGLKQGTLVVDGSLKGFFRMDGFESLPHIIRCIMPFDVDILRFVNIFTDEAFSKCIVINSSGICYRTAI